MTIAEQLKIKEFPFRIKDKQGNLLYREDSNGYWIKTEYDSEGREIYFENSLGIIIDNRPKPDTTHSEDWNESAYGSVGKKVYHINSDAETNSDDVITLNGIKYKRIDE